MTEIITENEIVNLAKFVSDQINESGILPEGTVAEYKAFFKQDVEKLKSNTIIYVCPHSEKWTLESRCCFANELTIDVAIQKKISDESVEDGMEYVSLLADKIARFLFGKSMDVYSWCKTEYYPYHGESLEVARTFVSIVSSTYKGMTRYSQRAVLK